LQRQRTRALHYAMHYAMHYGIRGCVQAGPTQNLSDIGPHVAAFLLLRGDYAFLSTGWSGCGSATHEHTYVQ
jgi:hypothetical protein